MQAPSEQELNAALTAIRAAHPRADVILQGVAEAYCVAHPAERLIYVSAARHESLTAGDEYVTWVVTLFQGEATEVSHFRSRACTTGDDTLPP